MHALCIQCAKALLLKSLIAESSIYAPCNVCGTPGLQVIDTSDLKFIRAIKALIRYHYSEWEYHGRLGGESFQHLLSIENPIIRLNPKLDEIEYEEFLLSFLQALNSDDQISLFTAYGRDIYNHTPFQAVSRGESTSLANIESKLRTNNYFVVEAEHKNDFEALRSYVTRTITAGTTLYRARIGAEKRAVNCSNFPSDPTYFYTPHEGSAIGAPPIQFATAGRANRPGVSFLYLATDPDTAMAEVRPHPGDLVSVGGFTLTDNQVIADLSSHNLELFYESDHGLDLLELAIAAENSLAMKAPPSNRHIYSLTQFLSEIFRAIGFDGIGFRSTVGTGTNIVLFKSDSAYWVEDSSQVFYVDQVIYRNSPQKLFDPETEYDSVANG